MTWSLPIFQKAPAPSRPPAHLAAGQLLAVREIEAVGAETMGRAASEEVEEEVDGIGEVHLAVAAGVEEGRVGGMDHLAVAAGEERAGLAGEAIAEEEDGMGEVEGAVLVAVLIFWTLLLLRLRLGDLFQ